MVINCTVKFLVNKIYKVYINTGNNIKISPNLNEGLVSTGNYKALLENCKIINTKIVYLMDQK